MSQETPSRSLYRRIPDCALGEEADSSPEASYVSRTSTQQLRFQKNVTATVRCRGTDKLNEEPSRGRFEKKKKKLEDKTRG